MIVACAQHAPLGLKIVGIVVCTMVIVICLGGIYELRRK